MQASAQKSSRRVFVRHFAEMVVAMLLGMGVSAALAAVAFAAAGSSVADQPGAPRVMLMGLGMTAPMVAWMSYRGHSGGRNAEMAASMMIPSAIAATAAAVWPSGASRARGNTTPSGSA